jgi:hypothetical protein
LGIGTSRFLVTANKRATALATARAFEAVISLARRPPVLVFVLSASQLEVRADFRFDAAPRAAA